jgi:AcrR family transcriptional regulator
MRRSSEARANEIIDVVVGLLDSEGYESVQVRTVAAKARVSLATIYELFGTRDDLIVTAVRRWMDANAYEQLKPSKPGESPYQTLVGVLHTVFEPWEKHPEMLRAYHYARASPGGDGLVMHGLGIVMPIAETALKGADPGFLDDLRLIFGHVVRAVIARFADGEIAITEVLPILERTLSRLVPDDQIRHGSPSSKGSDHRRSARKSRGRSA